MGYLVSVDVVPDTRCEEQEEYETELIENGQAVRCTECGELLTKGDRGFEAEYCEKCAKREAENVIRRVADAKYELRPGGHIHIAIAFLRDNFDGLVKYILDEEDDEK